MFWKVRIEKLTFLFKICDVSIIILLLHFRSIYLNVAANYELEFGDNIVLAAEKNDLVFCSLCYFKCYVLSLISYFCMYHMIMFFFSILEEECSCRWLLEGNQRSSSGSCVWMHEGSRTWIWQKQTRRFNEGTLKTFKHLLLTLNIFYTFVWCFHSWLWTSNFAR